jgi:hypothetical protein
MGFDEQLLDLGIDLPRGVLGKGRRLQPGHFQICSSRIVRTRMPTHGPRTVFVRATRPSYRMNHAAASATPAQKSHTGNRSGTRCSTALLDSTRNAAIVRATDNVSTPMSVR